MIQKIVSISKKYIRKRSNFINKIGSIINPVDGYL